MNKAKKLYTLGNQYYFESVFEYRGKEYTVEYSSGYTTFRKKPAYMQHKEAQERIDRALDNPVIVAEDSKSTNSFDEQIDEIWQLLGW